MISSALVATSASQPSNLMLAPMFSRITRLEFQLVHLQEIFEMASGMIPKHQHDQLLSIQKDHIMVRHDLLTLRQLDKLGLSESMDANLTYAFKPLQTAINSLELRLEVFKNKLFRKTQIKGLL